MKSAIKATVPVSNPCTVLQMIESASSLAGLESLFPEEPQTGSTTLKLHSDSEPEDQNENVFRLNDMTTPQTEQLIEHLRFRQQQLQQDETHLQEKIYRWEQQVVTANAVFRKQRSELAQHVSQIKYQQAELVKLQQSLIDSQDAVRAAVEKVIDDCPAAELTTALVVLRDELKEQFESNFQHWERLKVESRK